MNDKSYASNSKINVKSKYESKENTISFDTLTTPKRIDEFSNSRNIGFN